MATNATRDTGAYMPEMDGTSGTETRWSTVMTKRLGAPPLRFKGSELARHESSISGMAASIKLWKRRTSGYIGAVEVADLGDSVSRDSLEDILLWLEDVCSPDGPFALPKTQSPQPFDFVSAAKQHRAVRVLAGEALDHWDRLAETDAV